MVDYSTLKASVIKTLKPYVKPESYTIDSHMGSGCAGNPPGHPSYFVRSVYNRFGNEPNTGTKEVIEYNGKLYALPDFWEGSKNWNECKAKRDRLYKRLYKALPEDHPRVVAWINATYSHLKHCYRDPYAVKQQDELLIYPVPFYKLKTPRVDFKRWSVEYIIEYCKEIADYNQSVIDYARTIATPDNHKAVIAVREFYPDHVPTDYLIYTPYRMGSWWERESEQPTQYTCKGNDYLGAHPCNKTWCQECGWDSKREFAWRIVAQQVRHFRWMDGLS